jgi:hypothetical protein
VIVPQVLDDATFAYGFAQGDSAMGLARRAWEGAMVTQPRLDVLREGQNVWTVRIGERWSDMELTTLDTDLGTYFGATEGLLVRAPKDSCSASDGDVMCGSAVSPPAVHAMRIFGRGQATDGIDIMPQSCARE